MQPLTHREEWGGGACRPSQAFVSSHQSELELPQPQRGVHKMVAAVVTMMSGWS